MVYITPRFMDKIKLIVVAGPTASGKSDLAIRLARRFDGEIVSADSRQVYRGMDIATGKVTKTEQKLARHWMLDVASPKQQYSVAKFKRAAERAIADIARRGKLPIVCGGTGFWIDALVYDRSLPAVKPDAILRARLRHLTPAQLFARFEKLDPRRAATIDRHNPVRLIRALEIVLTTGHPVPARINGSRYEPFILAISLPKSVLAKRIARRLDTRLKQGVVAEVRRLHASGVPWRRLESFGLEYAWVARFLQKKTSRREMRDSLLRDIIAYSKRQMTWFRRNKEIRWVTEPTEAAALVRSFTQETKRATVR